jgi:hypothetical protein
LFFNQKNLNYKKISYWVLTIIFAGLMILSSFLYLSRQPAIVQEIHQLGYPEYMLGILGTAKILGVIALLQTRFNTLKEWAYTGFTINLIGASWSHLALGQAITAPVIILLILAGSYTLRGQFTHGREHNVAAF